jgi:hypothetical protein
MRGGGDAPTLQISTSTKRPPGTGQYANAHTRLLVHPFPDFVEVCVALGVEAVQVFWSV